MLVERYEYTPYGQRTVFFSPGLNDPGCNASTSISRRRTYAGENQPWGLCAIGHQGLMHDEETGNIYNRARMLSPGLGRFMQRDPLGYVDGMGLYEYVRSRPVAHVDWSGKNLYAVDGTWTDAEDSSNVKRFFDRTNESKTYWEGPNFGATGLDASRIFRGVKQRVCKDWCNDKSIKINFVGWSRGATIALEVTEELQDDGCDCGGRGLFSKNCYPEVNWIGLFDAVDMTLTCGWANNATSNVKAVSHAVKTSSQAMFPTLDVQPEDLSKTSVTEEEFNRHDGTRTNHNDIGAKQNNDALEWMIQQAKAAGVMVD